MVRKCRFLLRKAWDAISRYIYTGLPRRFYYEGWMKSDNEMITCCSDGTRPVIFKIRASLITNKILITSGLSD
ncbi:MAG: TIGR04076 family protein [Veillonella parvula]